MEAAWVTLRPFAIFQSESPPAPQLISEQSSVRITATGKRPERGIRMRATVRKRPSFIDITTLVVGAALAISFSGFLAWEVAQLPLIMIVAACSVLMVYALYDDARVSEKRELEADDGTR